MMGSARGRKMRNRAHAPLFAAKDRVCFPHSAMFNSLEFPFVGLCDEVLQRYDGY